MYVIHGWDLDNWEARTKEERRGFFENYTFELYIDDEKIYLRKRKHYYADQDLMKTGSLIEFKADHFDPETYTFRGVWTPTYDESTIKVTFHAP